MGTSRRQHQEREAELAEAHRLRRTPRYRSLVGQWLGALVRRTQQPTPQPLPEVATGQVGVTFAGHASVLLRYAALDIACDPMLGRWVRGVKRAVAPGLSPADLGEVDLVLLSHAHFDHLHPPTLARLPRSATVVLPPGCAPLVSRLGFARVVELSVGQSLQHRGVDVFSAAVRHDGDGAALSYVIRGDGPSVYFCGDSGYFSGFAAIGERFRPDIAVLPIGGYAPRSFRARHMSPLDALYALEDLGARLMIPIHHGAFALSYEHLHDPARWLAELVDRRDLEDFVVPLEPGESRVFVPPRSQRRATTQQRALTPAPVPPASRELPASPELPELDDQLAIDIDLDFEAEAEADAAAAQRATRLAADEADEITNRLDAPPPRAGGVGAGPAMLRQGDTAADADTHTEPDEPDTARDDDGGREHEPASAVGPGPGDHEDDPEGSPQGGAAGGSMGASGRPIRARAARELAADDDAHAWFPTPASHRWRQAVIDHVVGDELTAPDLAPSPGYDALEIVVDFEDSAPAIIVAPAPQRPAPRADRAEPVAAEPDDEPPGRAAGGDRLP